MTARLPFDADEMQAIGVALFGECPVCLALLEVDGSCGFAAEHKHECASCGAVHSSPLSEAHPCMWCGCERAA